MIMCVACANPATLIISHSNATMIMMLQNSKTFWIICLINPCPRRATIVNMIFMTSNLMHYNWSPSHFVQCSFLQDSISHFFWIIQLPMIMHLSIMYKMLCSWRYSQLKINLDIEIPNINPIKMCSFQATFDRILEVTFIMALKKQISVICINGIFL